MLRIATCLWTPNKHSHEFSKSYNESYIERLYRGCLRNLTDPFQFVVYTDEQREYEYNTIWQVPLTYRPISYHSMLEPFAYNGRQIVFGLDTVITGNIDFLTTVDKLTMPSDPFNPHIAINSVVAVPPNHSHIWNTWDKRTDDMGWLNTFSHNRLEKQWPHIVSYKCQGYNPEASIVYFHGSPKPHEIPGESFIKQHWT